MAEAILFDIGKNILSQLSSHAVQEIGRWWNVEHEFDKLERTVRTIQAVLIDAEDERELSEQFKHWLVELRRVLYDAEEVVDDFAMEALRRRVMEKGLLPMEVRLFFSSSNQLLHGKNMGNRIKEIREALDDITNDRQKFHFSVHLSETSRKRRDLSKHDRGNLPEHTKLNQDNVFGRENDRKTIKDLILKSDNEHKVIAIVGSGGLGKTTLAKLVFDDEDVKVCFELRMWVFVGEAEINVDKIVKEAERSVGITKDEDKKVEEPERSVGIRKDVDKSVEKAERDGETKEKEKTFREVFNSKKFLLVLDDIWDENPNKWSDLQNLWEGSLRESRIIVTTRSSLVAKKAKNPKMYNLDDLSPQDSWSLFSSIVFREEGQPKNDKVKNNAEKIVEKCGGVPLTIKTIGNMLYYLNPETDWLPYVDKELSKYPQAKDDIFPTLKLSYDHLPSPLRYCFAYCSLFPKGYIIDVQTLIQLWIAQGYIRPSEMGGSLEDIGLQYCKDLASRSFFQVERVDEISGDLVRCKMHDLMHDLASLVAGDEIAKSNSDGKYINKHTRHLNICGLNDSDGRLPLDLLESMLKAKKLRTFVSSFDDQYLGRKNVITRDECGKMFKNFTSLLALDLSKLRVSSTWAYYLESHDMDDWRLECLTVLGLAYEIPKSISRLKHLRYLDLSGQGMCKLPKSITKLYNLQVLKLKRCSNLIKLPKDIQKLISLRYLDCSRCWNLTHMPRGLRELVDLWYLNCSFTSLTYMPGLEKLVNLRYLYCKGCDGLTYMPCGLGNLSSLQTLTMFAVAPGGSRRSKHMACLDELGGLNLRGELQIQELGDVEIDESELQGAHLERKHDLLTLSLAWKRDLKNQSPTYQSPTYDENILKCLEPHPNLKNLEIDGYGGINFPNWFADLHNLVSLEFNDCNRCEYLPPLGGLRSLKNLTIWGCENLMYIESAADGLPQLGTRPTAFFPSLESLSINDCRKLKGWWTIEEDKYDDGVKKFAELPQFPRLSSLKIKDCPNLTCMPLFLTLNQLATDGYEGINFPNWFTELHNLVSLRFDNCKRCQYLPPIRGLGSLKELTIRDCDDLMYIENAEDGLLQLGTRQLAFFPSLESLTIDNCQKLKGWWNIEEDKYDNEVTKFAELPQFPRLSSLEIWNCPNLSCMPLFPTLNDKLLLSDSSIEPFQQTLKATVPPSTTPSSTSSLVHPLSNLKNLSIWQMKDLACLPEEWMQQLTSLQRLQILGCPHLKETCGNKDGADWHKISHIPNIMVDWEDIQIDGLYRK